jgi:hypothetical protein
MGASAQWPVEAFQPLVRPLLDGGRSTRLAAARLRWEQSGALRPWRHGLALTITPMRRFARRVETLLRPSVILEIGFSRAGSGGPIFGIRVPWGIYAEIIG